MRTKLFILSAGLLMLTACSSVKENPIKVNQVGYYPHAEKTAVLEQEAALEGKEAEPSFTAEKAVLLDKDGNAVWEGEAVREAVSPWSGKTRRIFDFTEVTEPGEYTLKAGKYSQPVVIREHAFKEAATAAMKSYYLQRTGCEIEEQYAGVYARPAAHPDTMILVHPSAASDARPAGTVISSPGGWYDAGDFNKYIVNSGFTVGMLLVSYQLAPEAFDALELNIPESGNDVPDFLDEIFYNIRWMATMQDPSDGGVYHKLTAPHFEGFVMPVECEQQRYVVQKSTAAALDFAATLALTSRIYRNYTEYAPSLEEYLKQAEQAYAWAKANPFCLYDQPGYNEKYEPQVSTGMYPDELECLDDEFFWASTELFLATGKAEYLEDAKRYAPAHYAIPVWGNLSALGSFEWFAQSLRSNSIVAQEMAAQLITPMTDSLDAYIAQVPHSCFQSPYGNQESDFIWGSNGEICSGTGVSMLFAYYMTGDEKYLTGAAENIDWLFGRNATGYCFLTGFGTKQVMHPHQRISTADGIEAPMPGFLAGGPNKGRQDAGADPANVYTTDAPDESYLDIVPSYATNEIAINWNAYIVALLTIADHNLK